MRVPLQKRDPVRLSAADAAWLHLEGPTGLMVVTALMITGKPLDPERLAQLLKERILCHPRFREAPTGHGARAKGAEGEPFDLTHHLRTAKLPPPGDEAALQRWIGERMAQPLSLTRPPWEVHLFEHYRGGSALVWRIHHVLGDGTALMRVLLDLADEKASSLQPPRPRHGLGPQGALRLVAQAPASLARLLLLPRDRPSPLKPGPLSGVKQVAWSEPIPLAEVKQLAKRHFATINDVLTTAMGGALQRHLRERGAQVPRTLRAIVPFDLRARSPDESLGNRFGILFLPVPIGEGDMHQGLHTLKPRMDRLKRSPEGLVAFALLELFGLLSPSLCAVILRFFARKATLVATNVAGPPAALSLRGVPLRDLLFWVPQSPGVGLGISILSYAGQVRVGIASDQRCLPAPQKLVDGFIDELSALSRAPADEGAERALRRRSPLRRLRSAVGSAGPWAGSPRRTPARSG